MCHLFSAELLNRDCETSNLFSKVRSASKNFQVLPKNEFMCYVEFLRIISVLKYIKPG